MQLFENIISYYGVIEGFVVRDLKDRYKSSYLGFFWTILHPLSLVVTYTFVFKYVFKVQIDHYVIYLLSGLIPWIFFTTAITNSSESIVHNFHLLFFLCPIAYHLEAVPQKYRTLYLLNPFALIIHLYHQVIIFNNFEFNGHVFYVCFFSFLVMYISYFLFKRKEWEFVERA